MCVLLFCAGCLHDNSSSTPTPSAPSSPSPAPTQLPPGIPPGFAEDVTADNVPAAALIPLHGTVTGRWNAATTAGDALLVAWEMPGDDPFARDRGLVAWRRFVDGGAPWRPVWGLRFPARRTPVLGIDGQIADVTGDGSSDALIVASTGGSGGCATTLVVDLAAGDVVYRSEGCDRTITPSSDPTGLTVREAVYAQEDPHCCPGSIRETTLVYNDGTWHEATSTTSPL